MSAPTDRRCPHGMMTMVPCAFCESPQPTPAPESTRMTDEEFDNSVEHVGWRLSGSVRPAFDRLRTEARRAREHERGLLERLHKSDRMANEVNILTRANRALEAERDRLKVVLKQVQDCIMLKMRADACAEEGAGRPPSISYYLASALAEIEAVLPDPETKPL